MAQNLDPKNDELQRIVPKKNATISRIWQYFGFAANNTNQNKTLCKICRKVIASKSGNTTNLFCHMKIHHPIQYGELQKTITINPKKQSSDSSITDKDNEKSNASCSSLSSSKQKSIMESMTYDKSSKRWVSLTNSVLGCLAKDMLPFYTCEKDGFKKMLKTFDSRYNLPGRKYFSAAIPKLYQSTHDQVQEEISEALFFAGTTDLWSSRTMEPYMSYTVHYVDKDWNLQSRHLQTVFFPDDHTGENLAHGLKDTLDSWGLKEENQVCLTTDNGSNIVKATQLNNWQRLQCFGHRLHLAVNSGLKDDRIDRAIMITKKVVSSFSYSYKKKRELEKKQIEAELPKHSLITACDTRWGSTQKMIERFLEQERAVQQVLSADRKSVSLIPNWQTIEVLECVNSAISPLAEFTDALSGEKHVSVSMVMPVIALLNDDILSPKPEDVALTTEIKTRILKYMNEKYKDESSRALLNIATFLDPRFKNKFLTDEEKFDTMTKLKLEILEPLEPIVATEGENLEDSPAKKLCLGNLFKRRDRIQETNKDLTPGEIINSEIERYLALPNIDYNSEPLQWWKEHLIIFPKLSSVVKKFLCIPATSCASERLFSVSGQIVSCKRTCLKPDKVDQLVFLSKNLRLD
ncbi:hypothetical protein SNE40_009950 [Patella caerulea]|uniref:BED-type domain-containing protein n=1 Tax=Patella caerulea TaxID=87958 RepID=A0AAN8Q3X7_PATCE